MMEQKLFVTALPIDADWGVLDPRVTAIVQKADLLIAEERKSALRLLAATNARGKAIVLINEHSTDDDREAIAQEVLNKNISVLVSDAGTPCIADPDYRLVNRCIDHGVQVYSVASTSSIMGALSVSGFNATPFIYLGFPPREKKERSLFFNKLANIKDTCVFLERPYAMNRIFDDMAQIKRRVSISVNIGGGALGKEGAEINARGTVSDVAKKLNGIKGAFVVVIEGGER